MLTEEKRKLELEAANIRKTALETIHTAGSGHIGGSFSMAEIVTVLYFKAMNIDPKDPDKHDRDRLRGVLRFPVVALQCEDRDPVHRCGGPELGDKRRSCDPVPMVPPYRRLLP